MASTTLLKDGLDLFSRWFGLKLNVNKSEIFFSSGSANVQNQILQSFGFHEGMIPFWYLGVPIIASRVSKSDCSSLVNFITARAHSWSQ